MTPRVWSGLVINVNVFDIFVFGELNVISVVSGGFERLSHGMLLQWFVTGVGGRLVGGAG